MTKIVEMIPEITVDYIERKHHHVIYQDGTKKLYIVCCGVRRDGELWAILDAGYAHLIELRGATKDTAVARAVVMLRSGEVDRLIEERHRRSMVGLMAVAAAATAAFAKNSRRRR
jgi:hypothetical protein